MHRNHVIILWKDSDVFLQASFTPYLNMDLILVKASTIVHLVTCALKKNRKNMEIKMRARWGLSANAKPFVSSFLYGP